VPWLVQGEFAAAWEPERRDEAPALVADRLGALDALCAQRLDRGANVVSHQEELVARVPIGGMHGELGRR